MKNAELFRKVKKYLLPQIGSGFNLKGNILYKTPITDIILGFCFERSANDKEGFYLWVFAQPLYIPSEDFILTFGKRLKRKKLQSEKWELTNETFEELLSVISNQGFEYLENVSSAIKFCNFIRKDKNVSIRFLEALVYSEFYCGMPNAESDAMILMRQIRDKEDLSLEWVKEIQMNVEKLLNANNKSKEEVQSILATWKEVSFNNLIHVG